VPPQRRLHRFGIALPADGTAFDVRKRKRNRADRQRFIADRPWLRTSSPMGASHDVAFGTYESAACCRFRRSASRRAEEDLG
jgi:hypothetical protein